MEIRWIWPTELFRCKINDLSLGQSEPKGITLTRYYNGTRRFSNQGSMTGGWINNYSATANNVPALQACLGGTTPAQAVPMIAATASAIALYNSGTPDPKNMMVTALVAKWAIDQITSSGVSVNIGKDILQFVQQPDGSFTPPAQLYGDYRLKATPNTCCKNVTVIHVL